MDSADPELSSDTKTVHLRWTCVTPGASKVTTKTTTRDTSDQGARALTRFKIPTNMFSWKAFLSSFQRYQNSSRPIRIAERGQLPLWIVKMSEIELANQITRIFSREWRHFAVAASDWLNQFRGSNNPATSISNQLSVFPRSERSVPNSGTFDSTLVSHSDSTQVSETLADKIRLCRYLFP